MVLTINSLSALNSLDATFTLNSISPKQYKRQYTGGYAFNFIDALSGCRDFARKTNTNFYISRQTKLSDIVNTTAQTVAVKSIYTPLIFGKEYLSFTKIDTTPYKYNDIVRDAVYYGYYEFLYTPTELSYFVVDFIDARYCTIHCRINFNKFYLVADSDKDVFFVRADRLDNIQDTVMPQTFEYVYDDYYNFLYITKPYSDGSYLLRKNGPYLNCLSKVSNLHKSTFQGNRITIIDKKEVDTTLKLNTSFITYESNNNINIDKSSFDLVNNYLIFKSGDLTSSCNLDIITLKNQVLNSGDIASSNNLLSGYGATINHAVNSLRDYTSITQEVDQEKTDQLELAFVFNNIDYQIKPGDNYFTAPESLEPFQILNVNDTKIAESGAFSFNAPYLADRIYRLDGNGPKTQEQHYLCTWLSGSPYGQEKIWVDRYYYPDRTTKQTALTSIPVYAATYNDVIEQLILSNSSIRQSSDNYHFFDKKSDLTFEPNIEYNYRRIANNDFEINSPIDFTQYTNSVKNWFQEINDTGRFTIGFAFQGNSNEFSLVTDRNDIDCGLSIVKAKTAITVELKLYNPSTTEISTMSKTIVFDKLKMNTIVIDFDSIAGSGNIFLNNTKEATLKTGIYKFTTKKLFFGDMFYTEQTKINAQEIVGLNSGLVQRLYISNQTYSRDFIIGLILYLQDIKVENITISLPSGMRSAVDNIKVINSISNNQQSKSNLVNIKVKNTNISSTTLLDAIRTDIIQNSDKLLPATAKINNITFENYK